MSSSGWPARYPIFQPPNAPILIAQGLRLTAAVTHRRGAYVGYYGALAVWAWDELARGENAVRRSIGAVTLGYVAARAGNALGRR